MPPRRTAKNDDDLARSLFWLFVISVLYNAVVADFLQQGPRTLGYMGLLLYFFINLLEQATRGTNARDAANEILERARPADRFEPIAPPNTRVRDAIAGVHDLFHDLQRQLSTRPVRPQTSQRVQSATPEARRVILAAYQHRPLRRNTIPLPVQMNPYVPTGSIPQGERPRVRPLRTRRQGRIFRNTTNAPRTFLPRPLRQNTLNPTVTFPPYTARGPVLEGERPRVRPLQTRHNRPNNHRNNESTRATR